MKRYFVVGTTAGLLSITLNIAFFFLLLALGSNPLGGSKALTYFPMLLMFFCALWYFREKVLGGELHFHQGFSLAFIVHLVACTGIALFIYLYLDVIDPSLLTRHKRESHAFLLFSEKDLTKTLGAEGFKQSLKEMEKVTPSIIARDEFWTRFKILLFFVFISSFVMRRTPSWSVDK